LEKVGQVKGFAYVERAFACISLGIGGNFGGRRAIRKLCSARLRLSESGSLSVTAAFFLTM
jgi:hypothetical protein